MLKLGVASWSSKYSSSWLLLRKESLVLIKSFRCKHRYHWGKQQNYITVAQMEKPPQKSPEVPDNNGGLRCAIITGVSKPYGIGRCLVHKFLEQGYKVAGLDIKSLENGTMEVQRDLQITSASKLPPDRFHFVHADISDPGKIKLAVKEAVEWFGGCIHVLINNAARTKTILDDEDPMKAFAETIAANLNGAYYLSEAVLPCMPPGHDFFVRHMVNDSLGVICNAHVVHADLSDYGALDENCLKLAELAAMAVDFPKTGKVAVMPQDLKPKLYPDFMDKEDLVSYRSEKILGVLYRRIKDMFGEEVEKWKSYADFENIFEALPYDNDLETVGFEEYIEEAWNYKCLYDQQLRALLGQFNVKKEGEVVTGHISSLSKHNSRRQGEIKERLQHAYRALRKEFRLIFEGTKDCDNVEPCKHSKYQSKASAWYHVTYHPTWVQKAMELTEPDGFYSDPLLSFPWISVDYLSQIKLQKLWPDVDYSSIDRVLATFLVGKA